MGSKLLWLLNRPFLLINGYWVGLLVGAGINFGPDGWWQNMGFLALMMLVANLAAVGLWWAEYKKRRLRRQLPEHRQ